MLGRLISQAEKRVNALVIDGEDSKANAAVGVLVRLIEAERKAQEVEEGEEFQFDAQLESVREWLCGLRGEERSRAKQLLGKVLDSEFSYSDLTSGDN